MTKYTFNDLEDRYQSLTGFVKCSCVFSTELVGGQPADEAAIRAFATHHLGITDPKELDSAVRRILKEEVGEKDVRPPEGELDEKQVYGVRVVRRTLQGPYLGNWMVKACITQAASASEMTQTKSICAIRPVSQRRPTTRNLWVGYRLHLARPPSSITASV